MKSNIRKKSNEENSNSSKNGIRQVPNNIYIIQTVKPIVQEDFDEAIKKFGEDDSLEIIRYMLSTRYLRRFEPQTPDVKSAVKNCVSALVRRVSQERIGKVLKVDEIQNKKEEELKCELAKLREVKKSIGTNSKTGIDKLIAMYIEEISKREKEQKEKEIMERNKAMEEARKIEEQKMQEQKAKAEEVLYYEIAKKYTNNFQFLAESEESYFSRYGGKNNIKFKNVQQYLRFLQLKNMVNNEIKDDTYSERDAIITVLKNKKNTIEVADRKILLERQSVIEKEMAKEER